MKHVFSRVVSIIGVVSLVACGSTPVADDVGQREANEIVSLLRERGIDADVSKGRGSRGRYSVSVPSASFGEAAALLSRLGLPADKKASFEEMTAVSGIIPSSREVEALRIDRAIAAEIEDMLKTRGDLRAVSVVVRYRSVEGRGEPSISLVAQRQKTTDLDVAELADVAARAVPGVKKESVFISLSDGPSLHAGAMGGEASPAAGDELVPFLGFLRVPASQYSGFLSLCVGLIAFVAALAGFTGYILGQFNLLRRQDGMSAAQKSSSDASVKGSLDEEAREE